MAAEQVKVLFVCLGNICRSPTAHGVFEHRVAEAGLNERIAVESCGTGDWHIGHPPDPRTQAAALERGYDLSHLRARRVQLADFRNFDYILAMDESNLSHLEAMRPADFAGHLGLFLDFADSDEYEVPDPYYGGDEGFGHVLELIEAASDGLLAEILSADRA